MTKYSILLKHYFKMGVKKMISTMLFFIPFQYQFEIYNKINLSIGDNHARIIVNKNNEKNALLSYITYPFILSNSHPLNKNTSNSNNTKSIVKILHKLGYYVDIIDFRDIRFKPKKKYDLFIGHGGNNFHNISKQLPKTSTRIYYSTCLYWYENNNQEILRFRYLEERQKVKLPYERWMSSNEEIAINSSDGIICLGNEYVKKTFRNKRLTVNINNAAENSTRKPTIKNYNECKKNFLFFGGRGNVHKGADILIEAFSQLEANLIICQNIEPMFYKIYKKTIREHKNIKLKGWVPMRSPEYYKLLDSCAFIINPSCAEGSPGSLVECMMEGLIPITTVQSGIDLEHFGILIKQPTVEKIRAIVMDLMQMDPEECHRRSELTRINTINEYSRVRFEENIQNAITRIINLNN